MKISIIGAGSVGSAVATAIQNTGLFHEIVLFDRDGVRSKSVAEDLGHASNFSFDVNIKAANNYNAIKGSEIVIVAAGANQKNNETRMDLVKKNADVISDIIPKVMKNVANKFVKIIILTNPLDVMVILAKKLSKLPAAQVIGSGTMLDTARFKILLGRYFNVSSQSITGNVLGEHGDSSVLNWSGVMIGGIPVSVYAKQVGKKFDASIRNEIDFRVKNAAAQIIKGRGATWDGIAAAVSDLVRCIAMDEKRILTVSTVFLSGKTQVAYSVPSVVGCAGVVSVLKPCLDKSETKDLITSKNIIIKNYNKI